MTIALHAWSTSNGRKISIALEEMEVPYVVKPVNILQNQQFQPGFVRISPNSKIPAIVDPDGVDGKPVSVFESGAILLYLAEKYRKFLPAALPERVPVLEWLMWQVGGLGPVPGQLYHFLNVPDAASRSYGVQRFMGETRRLYGVLDRRLQQVEHVADAISIADFAILPWVWRHDRHRIDLDEFSHVKRWYHMLMQRPGVRRGFAAQLD